MFKESNHNSGGKMKKAFCITLAGISIGLSCLAFAVEIGREDGQAADSGKPSHSAESLQEMTAQNPGDEAAKDQKKDAKKIISARVNGTDITLKSVLDIMNRLDAGKGAAAATPKDKEAAIKNALNKAVFYELAYQKAKAGGLKVEPAELDKKEAELSAKLGGTEALKKHLEDEMMTEEEMRAIFERSIILKRIFASEVFDRVVVSEDDIAGAYEKDKGKFIRPEKIAVTDIVFFLPPEEDASVVRAEEILRKILDDKDTNPYNLVPDGTFVAHDTELKEEKDGELCREARKLKIGEISGVIKTSDSLHIIKLREYSPEKQFELNEVKGYLKQKLTNEAQQKRLQEWEAELRKDAKIEIIETNGSK
jgi:hypothetical protein